MPARAKAAATEETPGTTSTSRPNSGALEGANDAEEARVAVGEDHGGASVAGDAAGGEGDAAEADAFGGRGHLGQCQVVGRAGDQCGGGEGGTRRGGQGEPSQPITVTRSAIFVSLQRVFAGRRECPHGVP